MCEEVLSTVEQFKFKEYNSETIESVSQGELGELDGAVEESLNFVEENLSMLQNLNKLMNKIRKSDEQERFWEEYTTAGFQIQAFQVFCAGLLTKTGKLQHEGAILYSTLLCMNPLPQLWNHILFNSVLSLMMTAANIIEAKKTINREDTESLKLSAKLLRIFSHAICEQFINKAQIDGLTAIVELAIKLSSALTDEYEKVMIDIVPAAEGFLEKGANYNLDYVIPYIVSALLLEYFPTTKKLNNRGIERRDFYLDFAIKRLETRPQLQLLVLKHLIMRCKDRIAARENVAYCVTHIVSTVRDKKPFLEFLVKLFKSNKSSLRIIALDISCSLLSDDDSLSWLEEETIISLIKSLMAKVGDSSPAVRGLAIDTITAVLKQISKLKNQLEVERAIGYPKSLTEKLERRIKDEKLVVRKASLRCLGAIFRMLPIEADPFIIVDLIAERTRDHAVSLRQEAAVLLTIIVETIKTPRAYSYWFESIFPLASDDDERTQRKALDLISSHFLNILNTETGRTMVDSMDDTHLDLVGQDISIFLQKSIDLSPFCSTVQEMLICSDCSYKMWSLAGWLAQHTPEHFRASRVMRLWDDRDRFPIEFYKVASYLPKMKGFSSQKEAIAQIKEDSFNELMAVANGKLVLGDKVKFAKLHYIVAMLKRMNEKESFLQIFVPLNNLINDRVNNQRVLSEHLEEIAPALYLLGELLFAVDNLLDYDFLGLKILISEKLPNDTEVPSITRCVASLSLGKLCLKSRQISIGFVAVFANQLRSAKDPRLKCNCLLVLSDLCIAYSAHIQQYIVDMDACFADSCPIVRKQALLIMTRLMAEGYVMMNSVHLFRFIKAIVDHNHDVARFARSCLFDRLMKKDQKLIGSNFIEVLLYFNNHLEDPDGTETPEMKKMFSIPSKKSRRKAFCLLTQKMREDDLFRNILLICQKVLQRFLDENDNEYTLENSEELLADAIFMMLQIEDQMSEMTVNEASVDDPTQVAVAEQARKLITMLHTQLTNQVLPTLNNMHHYLRANNSPLQSDLRRLYRKIVVKHPKVIEDLKTNEPILAAELEHDMATAETPMPEEEVQSPPPDEQMMYRSPLLSKLIRTPQISLINPSANASPMSVVSQRAPPGPSEKMAPIPFNLDED